MTAAFLVAAIALGALARALTGFGFALLAVPLLSLKLDLPSAVCLAILLQVAMVPRDLLTGRGKIERRYLLLLLAGALPAVPVGQAVLLAIPTDAARVILAPLILIAILMRAGWRGFTLLIAQAPAPVAGMLAGLMAGLVAMPGPPVVLHALSRGLDAEKIRSTLVLFFGILSICSLSTMIAAGVIDRDLLALAVMALPLMLLVDFVGKTLAARIPREMFERTSVGLLVVSAAVAIGSVLQAY
ncbi:sulfite exporter TauE/SafE family protein [Gemmobacter denitrificans]|uniref:Probable membrane transporter protein n=1 Tax=Gemmobacter denitrificans TaxID=3123040 RepID=A0ABU8BZ88_9RHOB